LLEVLNLDQVLKQSGKLVAVYWGASEFDSGLVRGYDYLPEGKVLLRRWPDEELQLATLLIVIYRWMQCFTPRPDEWLQDVRRELARCRQSE
jgi:hypothetical protein